MGTQKKTQVPFGKTHHVFFSYSTFDHEWVKKTVETLEKDYGLVCCLCERDNTPGRPLLTFVDESIQNSCKIVIVMTEKAMNSNFVKQVIEMAMLHRINKGEDCVIPVLLEDCEVINCLRVLHHLDVRDLGTRDIWMPKLAQVLVSIEKHETDIGQFSLGKDTAPVSMALTEEDTEPISLEQIHDFEMKLGCYQKESERRLIMIGDNRTERITLGNNLLGVNALKAEVAATLTDTEICRFGRGKSLDGKDIVVVDAPRVKDTSHLELYKLAAAIAPGPHAIVLINSAGDRITQECDDVLNTLLSFFGDKLYKYLIIVFTHMADVEKNASPTYFLGALPEKFRKDVKCIAVSNMCEKIHVEQDVRRLLALVDTIMEETDGYYFTNDLLKEVETVISTLICERQRTKHQEKLNTFSQEYEVKADKTNKKEEDMKSTLLDTLKGIQNEIEKREREKKENEKSILELRNSEIKLKDKIRNIEEKSKKKRLELEEKYNQSLHEVQRNIFQRVIEERIKVRKAVTENEGFSNILRETLRQKAADKAGIISKAIEEILDFKN